MKSLGAAITKRSSIQTYYTFMLLADPVLQKGSLDGYAYFRWVDDQIDEVCKTKVERLHFMRRQKHIIDTTYRGKDVASYTKEEKLVIDLIRSFPVRNSLLGSFIDNFIAIIEFDAKRNGSKISGRQLSWYSKTLAIAVIDCIQYFINHEYHYPTSQDKYRAAIGAHEAHMLRDYYEDLDEGYINIPEEYLKQHHISPTDFNAPAFRMWVKQQVSRARNNLTKGMHYWDNLPVLRAKLAAHWYCVRFTAVLDRIEKDGYVLRRTYPRKHDAASYARVLLMGIKVIKNHISQQK